WPAAPRRGPRRGRPGEGSGGSARPAPAGRGGRCSQPWWRSSWGKVGSGARPGLPAGEDEATVRPRDGRWTDPGGRGASPGRCGTGGGTPPGWSPSPGGRSGRSRRDQIGRHTSELQSRENLVCRLLLEKKKSIIL